MKNYKVNYGNLFLLFAIFVSSALIAALEGIGEIAALICFVASCIAYRVENSGVER